MPAGQPPGGLDRRFILGDTTLNSAGLDVSINYQGAARDQASGDILVAGNNSYVGLITDGIFSKLVEGANLPPSATSFLNAVTNKSGGGWLVLDGAGSMFRGALDLGSAWVDVSPGGAGSGSDLVEYKGTLMVCTSAFGVPLRDIFFSTDNGATWDTDPGDYTGINVNKARIVTNPDQNRLLVTSLGNDAAFTADSGSPPFNWTTWPFAPSVVSNVNAAAISDDGRRAVIGSAQGFIGTTDGFSAFFLFPDSVNPYRVGLSNNESIIGVTYVAGMAGFIVVSSRSMAFIPDSNMQQIFQGSYLGTLSNAGRLSVTDGIQALWPVNANTAVWTLRNVGQTGVD